MYLLNYRQKPGAKRKIVSLKASMFLKEMKNGSSVKTLRDQALDEKRQVQMKEMGSEFLEGDIRNFQIGMPVNHKIFGPGIILSKTLFFLNVHFEIGNKMFPLN